MFRSIVRLSLTREGFGGQTRNAWATIAATATNRSLTFLSVGMSFRLGLLLALVGNALLILVAEQPVGQGLLYLDLAPEIDPVWGRWEAQFGLLPPDGVLPFSTEPAVPTTTSTTTTPAPAPTTANPPPPPPPDPRDPGTGDLIARFSATDFEVAFEEAFGDLDRVFGERPSRVLQTSDDAGTTWQSIETDDLDALAGATPTLLTTSEVSAIVSGDVLFRPNTG